MRPTNSIFGNPVWDLCGFAIGLGLAWALDWQTRDLVWGLWLSSLVIGYASIVIGILGGINRTAIDNHPIAGIENFGIYAVVYAVYFFPWSFAKSWFAERNAVAEEGGQG